MNIPLVVKVLPGRQRTPETAYPLRGTWEPGMTPGIRKICRKTNYGHARLGGQKKQMPGVMSWIPA